MKREVNLVLSPKEVTIPAVIERYCAKKLQVKVDEIVDFRIIKRSIDARQRNIKVALKVLVGIHEPLDFQELKPENFTTVDQASPVIVVGAGPAGLFAAIELIKKGLKPIVLERGKPVDERKKDLTLLQRKGVLNENSNYAFGEGGAGTFSDGKLYTHSKKRGHVLTVLETFVRFGADPDILVDTHPHIGSDRLPHIIVNMRNYILEHGGEVHFNTRVSSLLKEGEQVRGVCTEDGRAFRGPVILSTGHSARDIYRELYAQDIAMEPKGFAVGVRLEHPQHVIDCIQYHNEGGRGAYLPAATYALVTQVDERGVYSFCMCPGGVIIPASTEPKRLVVNGMSASARASRWANSGIVVEVKPEDVHALGFEGVLGGLDFQEHLEALAYQEGGGEMCAPAQRMLDFVEGRRTEALPASSYARGLRCSLMHEWLPSPIAKRLQQAFRDFGRKKKGFLSNKAVLIGMESRTSAPVRIPRDSQLLSHVTHRFLYPCGEGSGYAGGIVSAAVDGIRCVEALSLKLAHVEP